MTVRTPASVAEVRRLGRWVQRREDDHGSRPRAGRRRSGDELRARRHEERDALSVERTPSVEQRPRDLLRGVDRLRPGGHAPGITDHRPPVVRAREPSRKNAHVIRARAERGTRLMKKPIAAQGQRGT